MNDFHARELECDNRQPVEKTHLLLQSVPLSVLRLVQQLSVPSADNNSSLCSDAMQNTPFANLDKLVPGVEGELRVCADAPAIIRGLFSVTCDHFIEMEEKCGIRQKSSHISVRHRIGLPITAVALLSVADSCFLSCRSLLSCSFFFCFLPFIYRRTVLATCFAVRANRTSMEKRSRWRALKRT